MGQDERMEELVVTGAVFLFVVLATSWSNDQNLWMVLGSVT